MPSISSSASRKTSLSSTSTTRTGMRASLFRADEERVVRLAALVHLDLEAGMRGGDPVDETVEWRWLGAGEEREERARLRQEMLDHREGHVDEVVAAGHRIAVREAEPFAVPNRHAVELDVARRARDLTGRDRGDRLPHL